MLFETFSGYLSKIEKISSRNEMVVILAELFKKTDKSEIDKAVYLLQGRVAPLFSPKEFNLSDKTLIKAICLAFNKTPKQVNDLFKKTGDLGEVVLEFKTKTTTGNLTINQTFEKLHALTEISGKGTIENKLRIISTLLKDLDGLSGKYIIRMLLAKLRLGFSDATILEAFSWMLKNTKELKPAIEKKYNIFPDLGKVGLMLKQNGKNGLEKIQVSPGTPILMAKCERANSSEEILEHGKVFGVEDKYDGFRLQIHICKRKNSKFEIRNSKKELFETDNKENQKEVVMYSRNLENVTKMYPDIERNILKTFEKIDSLIIEGEAVGFNQKTGEFLNFQETVQRKRKYDIEETAKSVPLKLIIFDVLYLNGNELLNETFEERRKTFESIVGVDRQKNIILSKVQWCNTPQEIEKKFKDATSENMEGIVAKKADGIYRAGARDWNWIKFKRGFQGQKLTDTIDCVVMGYDFGQGKRSGFGIGDFLIGVLNSNSQKYETVAKIGTGLTDEEWKKIKKEIDQIKTKEIPPSYNVKKEMKCHVWCTPKIVVEIMADEVTKSQMHTAGKGLALRFPRLVKFRPDKSASDITTVKELERMYKLQ